jgi:hypothetical protein
VEQNSHGGVDAERLVESRKKTQTTRYFESSGKQNLKAMKCGVSHAKERNNKHVKELCKLQERL